MILVLFQVLLLLFSGATLVNAASSCSATISSLADVADAVKCTTITLNGFIVPAKQSLILYLATGTTVTMNGDISFGNASWAGPLFILGGKSITFNGNGHKFDGGGPFYWDGQGFLGGIEKPHPMMELIMSGTFTNVKVVNSPATTYSVNDDNGALTMSNLIIDNSQGDFPNAQSKGLPAGHNTDGFDVMASDLTIENSHVHNQDDCLAINQGTNIVFQRNTCRNGHGISIAAGSGVTVSDVLISGNTIIQNEQALRIKTDYSASNSTVTNITYAGNTGIGMHRFGILIDQSYPNILKSPGTGVVVSDVNFKPPMSSITVGKYGQHVAVNCGACAGTWDWSYLNVTGGSSGQFSGGL